MTDPARFLITVGVAEYDRLPAEDQLPSVPHEIRTIVELFGTDLGYSRVLQDLAASPPAESIRARLSTWLTESERHADDLVVIYWSGHGETGNDGRHYLLASNFEGNYAAQALCTEDLGHILAASPVRNMLVMLDTCYSGQGLVDLSGMRHAIESHNTGTNPSGGGLYLVASSRRKEVAGQGKFSAMLVDAFNAQRHGGLTQPSLDPMLVIGAINDRMERERVEQRALVSVVGSGGGLSPLIPNPRYVPAVPVGLPVERARELLKRPDLLAHWGPRARGVGLHIETGDFFEGRVAALRALIAWLASGATGMRVVTGRPGSGKSAVLARLTLLSAPEARPELNLEGVTEDAIPAIDSVDVAIHARGKSVADVAGEIGEALGVGGSAAVVLDAIAARHAPVVIVVDALDEALDPRGVAREILRPLVDTRGAQVIVGSRSQVLAALSAASDDVIDLDDRERWFDQTDVERYVDRLLAASDSAGRASPYASASLLRMTVARQVALRAGGTFLIARLVARSLAERATVVDVKDPTWISRLPQSVGEAFEEWLDRFGEDKRRARDLLRPLAYADGGGLPWEDVWPTTATAIAGTAYGDGDVEWLLEVAGAFVIESRVADRSAYRLFHEALAEHLRPHEREQANQRRVALTLLQTVPEWDGVRRWEAATDYVRLHLSTHAAAGGLLQSLTDDAGFLVTADPTRLLRALSRSTIPSLVGIRRTYSNAFHTLPDAPFGERASYLAMYAHRQQLPELAAKIGDRFPASPWSVRWANVRVDTEHFVVGRHEGSITCVTACVVQGRQLAASGGMDGTVRVWDLSARAPVTQPLRTGGRRSYNWAAQGDVLGLAVIDDLAVVAAACGTAPFRLWNLHAGQPLTGPTDVTSGTGWSTSKVEICATTDHIWRIERQAKTGLVVRTMSLSGGLRAGFQALTMLGSDITAVPCGDQACVIAEGANGIVFARLLTALADDVRLAVRPPVRLAAGASLGGQPVVLVADVSGALQAFNAATGEMCGPSIPIAIGASTALAAGEVAGQPLVAIAQTDRTIRVVSFTTGEEVGVLLVGHTRDINALAITELDGRPAVISVSNDRTIRAWDVLASKQAPPPPPREDYPGTVTSVALSGGDDDAIVAMAGTGKGVSVRRVVNGGQALCSIPVSAVAVTAYESSGRTYVGVGTKGGVQLFEWVGGELVGGQLPGPEEWARALAITRLGERPVLVAAVDRALAVWDVAERAPAADPVQAHEGAVMALALGSISGTPIALTGGSEGVLRLWNLNDLQPRGPLVRAHQKFVTAVSVGSFTDRTVAASASGTGDVRIWDVETMELLSADRIGTDLDWIRALVVAELDGSQVVVSAGDEGIVRITTVEGEVLRAITIAWPVVSLSLRGSTLAVGTLAGALMMKVGL